MAHFSQNNTQDKLLGASMTSQQHHNTLLYQVQHTTDTEAVQLADRIILLDQGKIARSFKVDAPQQRDKASKYLAELDATVLQSMLST